MATCNSCACASVTSTKLANYNVPGMGIKVNLVYAAEQEVCDACGEKTVMIPNIDGLYAAVAVARAMHPLKLGGAEIRLIRKALGVTAKDLASLLEITVETISRWENDKTPIGPSSEKLLRIAAGHLLGKKAPAVSFDPEAIMKMQIQGVRDADKKLEMTMCLVKTKVVQTVEDAYMEERLAA